MSQITTNKETNFSLHNMDNYVKELDSSSLEIIHKLSYLILEYLKFIFENITIKNNSYTKFVIIRGLNTIIHVFRNLLFYTKNLDLTYFHCQKSFYFYVEFVGQILEDDKSFLQLTTRDATIYVYKKTVYDINNEYKKKHQKLSIETSEKIKMANAYINICIIYINKILSNNDFSLDKNYLDYLEYFEKITKKYDFLELTLDNLLLIEKITEKIDFYVKNIDDFFEINTIFLKKNGKTFQTKKIWDKFVSESIFEHIINNEASQITNTIIEIIS
jgi:hypothetical protein